MRVLVAITHFCKRCLLVFFALHRLQGINTIGTNGVLGQRVTCAVTQIMPFNP